MKILIFSENKEWKDYISRVIDTPDCTIHEFDYDLASQTGSAKDFDLILLDLDIGKGSINCAPLYKVRAEFGWWPYVISLSSGAASDREELLNAISNGSDDFLEDPFDIKLLLSKLSVLSRRRYHEIAQFDGNINYSLKMKEKTVLVNGEPVKLNDKEFELFLFFFGNTNSVFDRESIYDHVWGGLTQRTTRTLDTHASRIRKRLKLDGSYGLRLKPVYGVGYMMESVNKQYRI
ncbi:response regulator transcription factor [Marinobacter szutsaonensis]